ncbi:hypothetical protein FBU30_008965 [Linnemannia zychae]|nr:hypothetical protein FBU30_008965 [Linnemannia zychae]
MKCQFFAPVQIGTPAQTFYLMLDTGSSLSWIQTTDCQATPQLCNQAPKFNISLSSTIIHEPEMISVRYTEGTIPTRLASDIVILGTASPPLPAATPDEIEMNTSTTPLIYNATSSRTNISGDPFLLDKETKVPGFLGASQKRFESDSVFTEDWGTLTLGGPDPSFYSKPLTWINTLPNEPGWVTQLSPQINIYPKGSDSQLAPEFETDYVITNLDRVWFDSGTTYIWGDERAIRPLNDWMGADPVTGQVNCSLIPLLGTIVFSIGGTRDQPLLRLELSPAEYIIGKSTSRKCFTALNISASKKDHWIFGLYVLRAFYTVYHYEYGLIGIGE